MEKIFLVIIAHAEAALNNAIKTRAYLDSFDHINLTELIEQRLQ